MIATKFKPFMFSLWGFALSSIAIHFHFHDSERFLLVFCITLLCNHKRTEFGHIMDQCAPWEIANAMENFNLHALQFQYIGFCRKFPTSMSHYRSNQYFVEGQFNVNA
jgi:hypothetical protein